MKEITTNKGTFLFVEVPDDACDFNVIMEILHIKIQKKGYSETKYIELSDKRILDFCKIISTTKDITEEQAENIVDFSDYPNRRVYQDYETKNEDWLDLGYFVETTKESLQSLIQTNSLDINKNYLILLKK
jgi:hypothetical protein